MMGRLRAWLRIPVLLVRFPAILLSVVGAAMVLAVSSAASTLFLASAGTAAMRESVAMGGGRVPAFTVIDYSSPEPDLFTYRDRLLTPPLRDVGLATPVRSVFGTQVGASRPGHDGETLLLPMTREGAAGHVSLVEGEAGSGALISDRAARVLDADVGDRLELTAGEGKLRIPIAGIYRDLLNQPRSAYWAPLAGLIYVPNDDPDAPPPPSFLILDRVSLLTTLQELSGQGQFRWEFPVDTPRLTLPKAERLARTIARVQGDLGDPSTRLGSAFPGTSYTSPVFGWVTAAQQTVAGITGPVETLSLAARIVALVVVAAAGAYAVHRRRVEFELLNARGVTPLRLGIRSGLETLLPAAAGAALGWAVAVAAVKAFGPGGVIPAGSATDALREVAWTGGVGVALVGLAAGMVARGGTESRRGRVREAASRIPWEAVVLALAAAAFYEIVTRGGGPIGAPDEPPRVDRLLLLFPILFVAGTAGLAVRVLRRALPRLRAAKAGSPPAYLALRRLASAPRMALLLVTASALAVGMLAYAGVLSSSIRTTADDKASLSTGSDVSVILGGPADAVPGIPSTPVERLQEATLGQGGPLADILGIDRRTFPQGAFWDSSVIGSSIEDVMRGLAPGTSDRLPVVLIGKSPPSTRSLVVAGGQTLPIRVVMTLPAFPGNRPGRASVVADMAGLERSAENHAATIFPIHELWAKGEPATVLRQLSARGIPLDIVSTPEEAKRSPRFLALSWTFGYLEALGVAAGLVALLGMVLYLQARQRDREVAYALARRMGLSSAAHAASVAAELAGMLLAAFVIGTGLAVIAAVLVFGKLDPLPGLPPGPLLRYPFGLFAASVGVLILSSLGGAWIVQRRADRANVAEVMRLAG